MANLTETATFEAGIYQLETTDPVLGGPGGIDNLQPQQLANRTKYLKAHVDALEAGTLVPPGIATEAYVQNELEKLDAKQSVRAATTADITLSGAQTIDGVSVIAGDRVLVKNQSDGTKNGIYSASATAWTRALDANESEDVTAGMTVVVAEGTLQAETIWKLATNDPITLGSTALVFADITAGYAPLASPSFTGNPSAPTPSVGDNDTSLATTEFVMKATDGMATVSVAGGANVTLTTAQHGLAILNLTGIITADFSLIFPTGITGQWVVANNTTGAFNITAKTAAGTGVVAPQGYAVVLYGDGTNIYAASAAGQASLKTQHYTPSAGTTSLSVTGGYTTGAVIVEKNGALLDPGIDYVATSGANITGLTATTAGDEFTVYAFSTFNVANAVQKSGDTMSGALVLPGNAVNALEAVPKQQLDAAVAGVTVAIASTVEAQAGANDTKAISPLKLKQAQIQLGTAVATTSGTAIDFTGIPAWAKRVTVMLNAVSTNGASLVQIQLGAGSIDTTGYSCISTATGVASSTNSYTSGAVLYGNGDTAAYTRTGLLTFSLIGSNTWVFSGVVNNNFPANMELAGSKTLAGTLDRLRLTTVNGTDAFDAGSVNISWE